MNGEIEGFIDYEVKYVAHNKFKISICGSTNHEFHDVTYFLLLRSLVRVVRCVCVCFIVETVPYEKHYCI